MKIGVLHGPNLNLLGTREPEVYGSQTLPEINESIVAEARALGVEVDVFQSNVEGELVDWIQRAGPVVSGFVVNAAAYTHTSVAIADALSAVSRPFVEVHLSNPASREAFRHVSLLAPRAAGVVVGFGAESYLLGLRGLVKRIGGAR